MGSGRNFGHDVKRCVETASKFFGPLETFFHGCNFKDFSKKLLWPPHVCMSPSAYSDSQYLSSAFRRPHPHNMRPASRRRARRAQRGDPWKRSGKGNGKDALGKKIERKSTKIFGNVFLPKMSVFLVYRGTFVVLASLDRTTTEDYVRESSGVFPLHIVEMPLVGPSSGTGPSRVESLKTYATPGLAEIFNEKPHHDHTTRDADHSPDHSQDYTRLCHSSTIGGRFFARPGCKCRTCSACKEE